LQNSRRLGMCFGEKSHERRKGRKGEGGGGGKAK